MLFVLVSYGGGTPTCAYADLWSQFATSQTCSEHPAYAWTGTNTAAEIFYCWKK
jgi:hypothetical protein